MLCALGKVVGGGAHLVAVGLDGRAVQGNIAHRLTQAQGRLVEILTQPFQLVAEGLVDARCQVAVGKAGEALSERRDGGVQRFRIGKLGRSALAAFGIAALAVGLGAGFQIDLFDGCKAEAFGGTGHFADLVAAFLAGDVACQVAVQDAQHAFAHGDDAAAD